MRFRKSKLFKFLAAFMAFNIIAEVLFPAAAYALTSGPSSPEHEGFQPVSVSEMVNTFTGDFNYNVPVIEIPGGADGGGYALSLSYDGPQSPEQEASWVGFGWNLSPGAINRDIRGYADDAKGDPVLKYNKQRPNWTLATTKRAGLNIFGQEMSIGIAASKTRRFNSFQGYHNYWGVGLSLGIKDNIVGLSLTEDANGVTFDADVSFQGIVSAGWKNTSVKVSEGKELTNAEKQLKWFKLNQRKTAYGTIGLGGQYGLLSYKDSPFHISPAPYNGYNFSWNFALEATIAQTPIGIDLGSSSSFSLQFNKYLQNKKAWGYAYTSQQSYNEEFGTPEDVALDYYVEKDYPFQVRNTFIGMPFNSADVFQVSGEGMGGSFRAFAAQIGEYHPSGFKVTTGQGNLGFKVLVGPAVGVGLNVGGGFSNDKYDQWKVKNSASFGAPIFRFANDMGGSVEYSEKLNQEPFSAGLAYATEDGNILTAIPPVMPGFKNFAADAKFVPKQLISEKAGATSYITPMLGNNGIYKGFEVVNAGGAKYSYGEPVYSRYQADISVNVDNKKADQNKDVVKGNALVFKNKFLLNKDLTGYKMSDVALKPNNMGGHSVVMGEIKNTPFASSFLLTQIVTPDYIDLTGNGGSDDDFGGYTKFKYRTVYGGAGAWYRWRQPYAGMMYDQNTISDKQDDLATVSTGEKEIKLLEKIETKTHVAYFVTNTANLGNNKWLKGSGSERLDARSAAGFSLGNDQAALKDNLNKVATSDVKPLQYLEKIVLFAKDPKTGLPNMEKPVKVVRFEYDYSLCPNTPNNKNANFNYGEEIGKNVTENSGKLTLRRLWFESEGIVSAKVNAFEFRYSYPSVEQVKGLPAFSQKYFEEYFAIPDIAENPIYTPYSAGPWGYPMANAENRRMKGIPFIDQSYSSNEYDPAAYHLKTIKLPSGGEIHIQYEEDDYRYVQDREAMAMARLVGYDETGGIPDGVKGGKYYNYPVYYIDPKDLGAKTDAEVDQLAAHITDIFKNRSWTANKAYFKFLYTLSGATVPALDDCRSEYITGYTDLLSAKSTTYKGQKVVEITLGGQNNSLNGDRAPVPRQACYEFVANTRQGKVDYLGSPDCIESTFETTYSSDLEEVAYNEQNNDKPGVKDGGVLGRLLDYSYTANTLASENIQKKTACKMMNPGMSFIKLPMHPDKAKKGGGNRVKRVLMTTTGNETGDAAVYGTEYYYVTEDGKSSGVATNEPTAMREENPWVHFMRKGGQGFLSQIIAGRDREQIEGPLGETIMPGPSVGYSRVVAQSINNDKTRGGYSVTEFYTAKDYPMDYAYATQKGYPESRVQGSGVEKTLLGGPGVLQGFGLFPTNQARDFMAAPLGAVSFYSNKVWSTQGFRFVLNDMHGKVKKASTYAGMYDPKATDVKPVAYQEYFYHPPATPIKMWAWDEKAGTFKEYYDTPGVQQDIASESKRARSDNFHLGVAIGVTLGLPIPPIIITPYGFVNLQYDNNVTATHATTTVVRYPAIIHKVLSFKDGVYNWSENVAYDAVTGSPLVVKTYDGFHGLKLGKSDKEHDGSYYNVTIPAHWMYEKMGQKAVNTNYTNQLGAAVASISTYAVEPNPEWFKQPTGVLGIGVQTYSDGWGDKMSEKLKADFGVTANALTAFNKFWKPKASYSYRAADGKIVSDPNKRVYESGFYNVPDMFDWKGEYVGKDPSNNWIKASEVTQYNINGNAVEERNALGIYSAVMFDKKKYGGYLPVMTAANASHEEIFFEDYEAIGSATGGHSGFRSQECLGNNLNIVNNVFVTNHLKKEGAYVRFWLKPSGTDFNEVLFNAKIVEAANNPKATTLVKRIARSGEWILYEAEFKPEAFQNLSGKFTVNISYQLGVGQKAYVDDVRMQPMDSEASCFVYDSKDMSLLAQFDDQHFGVYYIYDQEGNLISKKIETERGMKVVSETQQNVPGTPRKK